MQILSLAALLSGVANWRLQSKLRIKLKKWSSNNPPTMSYRQLKQIFKSRHAAKPRTQHQHKLMRLKQIAKMKNKQTRYHKALLNRAYWKIANQIQKLSIRRRRTRLEWQTPWFQLRACIGQTILTKRIYKIGRLWHRIVLEANKQLIEISWNWI